MTVSFDGRVRCLWGGEGRYSLAQHLCQAARHGGELLIVEYSVRITRGAFMALPVPTNDAAVIIVSYTFPSGMKAL